MTSLSLLNKKNNYDLHSDVSPSPLRTAFCFLPFAKNPWWKKFLSHELRVGNACQLNSREHRCAGLEFHHSMSGLRWVNKQHIVGVIKRHLGIQSVGSHEVVARRGCRMFPPQVGSTKDLLRELLQFSRVGELWLCANAPQLLLDICVLPKK